ncbi:low molecular weight phosphotyrosine protein phosphatase [Paraburkholderia sp. Ac-20336]|uniref:arsenate reductase/protein-tyrosine-phosphatase family protein n=1 Tax=unclassified Paraburkholderia TaxID=2615204 RepID=UPI001420B342|nr:MULTISPECIES: low molecular weight phosphotyrosine protein phosphatase [unclassified Paraburkholderia]MBN3804562.1 low molecular weight phosphotyrosine protein phosphatase [Paraburkholderia sp. Ac-20336]NIF80951.1 low molecular weight phosphotyrosine protein phosphatase [Paraburkholderia sp. Cy-641]
MIDTVLIVCEGNLCRSPIGQGLLQNELADIKVMSAGLSASTGTPIDRVACEMLSDRGIDMSSHRARRVNERICVAADLILVMELAQKQVIENFVPTARGRIFRLAESERVDVLDPIGRSPRMYAQAMTLIERGVQDWTKRIANLSRGSRL